MTERSQRSGSKGGLSARIRLRSCLFQPPHGILRIVSAEFSMLLSSSIFISYTLPSNLYYCVHTELYLLQAEEQFCSRNFETAETLYDAAILSSKMHKFVNEEALANELAGHFYLETGRRNKSVHYFSRAFDKYNEWGAVAKASALTEYLDESER